MRIFLLAFLILSVFSSVGQDLIINKSGDTTKAIVLAVFYDNIQYRKFENPNGPVLTVSKYDLSEVRYSNGEFDVFIEWKKPQPADTIAEAIDSNKVLYDLGMKDADISYKGYHPAATGTFITSALLSPVIGIVAVGACNTDKPTENLGFPDPILQADSFYHKGYMTAATRKKSKKVWANFYFGTLTWIILVAIAYSKVN